MRLQHILAAGVLGLGLLASPMVVLTARAEDPAPKQEAPAQKAARGPTSFIDRYHKSIMALSDLTDEQKTKIEPLFKDAKTKADAAIKEAGDDRSQIREKIRPIMTDLRKGVDEVLTQAQKDKLKADRDKARANRNNGNGGANGGTQKQ